MNRYMLLIVGLISAILMGACVNNDTQPTAPEFGLSASKGAPKKGTDPIAQIAIDNGFDELVAALTYVDDELGTGLVDLFLNGTDQYTVFAPTDEAFENLYALLSDVLGAPIDEITDIDPEIVLDVLLYHVTEGRRASNSVLPKTNNRTITPLLEEPFYVRPDGTIMDGLTGIRDNDAAIDTPNISASNGIIHVITEVIVPPSVVAALTS
ncbi:MAG: fasciclin domain-containing protein [bacterium]